MTSPVRLPPPLDYYNRPAKELAGYQNSTVPPGGAVPPPVRPFSASESIPLYTAHPGRGLALRAQPAAVTDYHELNKEYIDPSPHNAARVIVNVHVPGFSTARARLYYSHTGTLGSWLEAGVDLSGNPRPIGPRINNIGVLYGDGPLNADAISGGERYWAVMWDLGDGIVTPVIGNVHLQFITKTYRACVWTTIVDVDEMVAPGETTFSDVNWITDGVTGIWQPTCFPPDCMGWINVFRFGSGAPLNGNRYRQFSVLDFPELYEGRDMKFEAEMAWTYGFFSCGWEANPDFRITVGINNVTYSNVPSGFPPTDVGWLPVEIIFPADGAGVKIAMGIYGDNGVCSVSVNAMFRNFRLSALDDGVGGTDCI